MIFQTLRPELRRRELDRLEPVARLPTDDHHFGYSNGAPTANRGYISRILLPRTRIPTALRINNASATTDSNCQAAIYDATGTTKLLDSGTVTGIMNGAGLRDISLNQPGEPVRLDADTVYYALFVTAGTPTLSVITAGGNHGPARFGGASLPYVSFDQQAVTIGSLPSSLTIPGLQQSTHVAMALVFTT